MKGATGGAGREGCVMRDLSMTGLCLLALGALTTGTGCAGALVQPGHRALFFDPAHGGIQHEVLQPGWYRTACPFWEPDNKCPRVDDFDVTYSTAQEEIKTLSVEKLPIELNLALKYRPVVAELYLLATEIGANYFDEVIGPEMRSAAIGVLARTSYQDLQKENGTIEDDIEKDLRGRLKGKHIEIASVLIEKINYAPQILEAYQQRVVSQEEALTSKQLLENAALRRKREGRRLAAETKQLQERLENQSSAEEDGGSPPRSTQRRRWSSRPTRSRGSSPPRRRPRCGRWRSPRRPRSRRRASTRRC